MDLYKKQFGFQKQHSTDYAIVHLVNKILKSFENNCYTLGVFIDLTKAFDTVDHINVLLKKLFHYGVRSNNLKCQNYRTEYKNVICDVPQGSILGPLLFYKFINFVC